MEIRELLAVERRNLADVLAELTPEQWAAPSLAAGWTTRHVVAHLVMPFRYSTAQMMVRIARARGRFDRVADAIAKKDAALSTAELTAALRDNALHPYTPPGAGYEAPLTDLTVHAFDICRPLGIDHRVSPEALRIVLGNATGRQAAKYFGISTAGIRLTATDVDWAFGDGAPVCGRAQDLLLVLCGRPAGRAGLEGPGASLLAAQLAASA